jgi:hypothetical protein
VPRADIDIGTWTALCRPCGEVTALPKPGGLVWDESGELETWGVAIPMKRTAAVGLALCALFLDWAMVSWYRAPIHGFASGQPSSGPLVVLLLVLLLPLPFVVAGVLLTYQAFCGIFNTAYVRLDREAFRFERRPIPMRGNVSEPTDGISGFEPLEENVRSRRNSSISWDVNLLTNDRRAVRVSFGFSDYGHAAYAASRLARQLEAVKKPMVPYRA